ncbi:hypothetical protein [Corynebacterium durum]|uniref:hypothetical protein n=1 Tax=Corynebacterium durum TaxID=61592 RepID=UPI0015C93BC8|nr:hypothetical protein [Corynebacterium durum]NYI74467.1 HAMP domain-containing protein [Corynebacterium durum]
MTANRRIVATIFAAGILLGAFLDWSAWTQVACGLAALVVVLLPNSERLTRP